MAPWHLKKGTIQVDGISHQLHTLAKSPTVTMANSKVTPNSLCGSYQQHPTTVWWFHFIIFHLNFNLSQVLLPKAWVGFPNLKPPIHQVKTRVTSANQEIAEASVLAGPQTPWR